MGAFVITLDNRHDPAFALFPINNDRTAWKPFGLPILLVVPDRRDPIGVPLPDSDVWGVRVYIQDVPHKAVVVGHQHIDPNTGEQIRFPDRELYAKTISQTELQDASLSHAELDYYRMNDAGTPQPIAAYEAVDGDLIRYTTTTGVTDYITYLQSADYYDLSAIALEVEQLPSDRYLLVYECRYFTRQRTNRGTGELLCIDPGQPALARYEFQFNHPGEVLDAVCKMTPPEYFTDINKASDTTIEFYRPLTDALQDVYDEQILLQKLNWVRDCPNEIVPYLSVLLGWDVPYFPQSLDALRRVMLRNTSWLQTIKGSKRSMVELFKLLGLDILIVNLWWSADGKRLIGPNYSLPDEYGDQRIVIEPAVQIETVIDDWRTSGYGQLTVPLLFRPTQTAGLDKFTAVVDGGDVVLDFYLVERGGAAHAALQTIASEISQSPESYYDNHPVLRLDAHGVQHTHITDLLNGEEIGGYSQVRISGEPPGQATTYSAKGWGVPPVGQAGVSLDRTENVLKVNFDGYIDFDGNDSLPPKRRASALYGFATYVRQKTVVPDALADLQSNWFDIQLLQSEIVPPLTGEKTYISSDLLDFAFEFLQKVKAFHSLLNSVHLTVELTETYETTGIVVGGDVQQRYDVEMGRLQVPPAIIPKVPGTDAGCADLDALALGYKRSDIIFRMRQLANLPEEFEAWKALDQRADETYQVTGRLSPQPAADGRDECLFTPLGQDRTPVSDREPSRAWDGLPSPAAGQNTDDSSRLSPGRSLSNGEYPRHGAGVCSNSDSSSYGDFAVESYSPIEAACTLDGVTDYRYSGRVGDGLLHRQTADLGERFVGGLGPVSLGAGVYWTYPAIAKLVRPGVNPQTPGSMTVASVVSGACNRPGVAGYLRDAARTESYLDRPSRYARSYLGSKYRSLGTAIGETLHYSDRPDVVSVAQNEYEALNRPGVEVGVTSLHFPGCRFLRMNLLMDDYTSTTWRAKPWDEPYSISCGPRGAAPSWLNARLESHDGSEFLVYDDAPYTIVGDGFEPDIPSLSTHSGTSDPTTVVHAIYSSHVSDGHPAVELSGIVQLDGTIDVDVPLFSSHAQCGTSFQDYADGYKASVGQVSGSYTPDDRNGVSFDAQPSDAIFHLGDGVFTGEPGFRLDAGCSLVRCGTSEPDRDTICALDVLLDQDGALTWEPDQVWLERSMRLEERPSVGSIRLDGSIGLFDLLPSCVGGDVVTLVGDDRKCW